MTQISIELAPRTDGARYRQVTLVLEGDGSVTLKSHEMGGAATAPWLDDDEVTLSVSSEEAPRLALALAAEVLKGGQDGVARLSQICDAAGVQCRVARWT
jgi:hypothetical protein